MDKLFFPYCSTLGRVEKKYSSIIKQAANKTNYRIGVEDYFFDERLITVLAYEPEKNHDDFWKMYQKLGGKR